MKWNDSGYFSTGLLPSGYVMMWIIFAFINQTLVCCLLQNLRSHLCQETCCSNEKFSPEMKFSTL